MRKLTLGAILLLAVGACATPQATSGQEDVVIVTESNGLPPGPVFPNGDRPQNAADCGAAGGQWERAGMLGQYRCTFYFQDAGNVCADGADCMGKCLAEDSVSDYDAPPGTQRGVCAPSDSPFGCYAEVSNGTVGAMLCVD